MSTDPRKEVHTPAANLATPIWVPTHFTPLEATAMQVMLLWGNPPLVLSRVIRVQVEPEKRTSPPMVPIHLSPEESRAMAVTILLGRRPEILSALYVVHKLPR